MTELHIPGDPAGQGSKRHVGKGVMVEASKRTRPYRQDIRQAAINAGVTLEPGPWRLTLLVRRARPRTHYRAGDPDKGLSPRGQLDHYPCTTPDLDKVCRAVCDALTGIAWTDDKQVVVLAASRQWAATSETVLWLDPIHPNGDAP